METASMANRWVDSYLSALLGAGLSTEHFKAAAEQKEVAEDDADAQIAAKYYVNQILNLDEESITQAWLKVSHKSNVRLADEQDARLQYLSWRVWGMKRRHATVQLQRTQEGDLEDSDEADTRSDGSRVSPVDAEEIANLVRSGPSPSLPRLSVQPPAAGGGGAPAAAGAAAAGAADADDSDDRDNLFSPVAPGSPTGADVVPVTLSEARVPKLYCVLISMHGLVRGDAMELGKDPDTGGQVKYVVELAKALSRHPAVHRVDLLTRLIRDPKVAPSYGELEEALTEPVDTLGGAYICRVKAGPVGTYLRKEQLWPYVREFADNALTHVVKTMGRLAKAGEPCELYNLHGHYADAGEAAALMSYTLGVEMVLTGHSLGRNKLDHLLKSGTMSRAEIEAGYAISRRIEAEERSLDAALLVFTSTHQEVKDQWGLYDGYNADLERVVRQRVRRGRHFPIMHVVPPGLDFSNLKIAPPPDPLSGADLASTLSGGSPHANNNSGAGGAPSGGGAGSSPKGSPKTPATPASTTDAFMRPVMPEDPPIWRSIFKFLRNPRKPVILAMSRPDAKKNITTLVRAYGKSKALREIANLVLVMGNREVIDSMAPGSSKVLEQVLKLIDAYDLYGSVAYPKRHTQDDISDIYLLPAATRGVFVNIALQEPFGLTLIEAAAHGVPIVATTHGGPVDIVHTLSNGILVDPTRDDKVAEALLDLLTNSGLWDRYAASGVANINAYSWSSHCIKCLNAIEAEKINWSKRSKQAQLRSNFSASLDDFTFNTISGSFTGPSGGSGSGGHGPSGDGGGLLSPRATATLVGQSFTTDDINPSEPLNPGLSLTLSKEHSASSGGGAGGGSSAGGAADGLLLSPRSSGSAGGRGVERGLAASSVPLTGAYGGSGGANELAPPAPGTASSSSDVDQQLGQVRDKYMVFCLDSSDTLTRLSKLLARKGKVLTGLAAAGHSVGLAVCSAFSLPETMELLAAKGIAMSDLDFAVTSCGAEVWYCGDAAATRKAAGTAGGGKDEAELVLDDAYDAKLDLNWDGVSVRRVLNQCMGQLLRQAAAGNAAAAAASAAAAAPKVAPGGLAAGNSLSRRSSLSLSLPRCKIQVAPTGAAHHLTITLEAGSDGGGDGGGLAPAGDDTAAATDAGGRASRQQPPLTAAELGQLISRIKRRLRKSGLRAQIIAQQEPGATRLHILPLRGSRALALRHLTYRHRVDMSSLVLVACARDLAPGAAGAAGVARFACSDAEDLVSGVQGVLVVPPAAAPAAGASSDGFPVDLELFTHDGRLQLLPGI